MKANKIDYLRKCEPKDLFINCNSQIGRDRADYVTTSKKEKICILFKQHCVMELILTVLPILIEKILF